MFLADANSFYFATASGDGQPYIQHRGGPKGFLKVLDKQTLAFTDYAGNRQYITQGNLSENPKAYIFVMDYAHRRRVKIWGEARVVEDDEALTTSLMPKGYRARPEQVILFKIAAWDTNCPQHIPQKFDAPDVAAGAGGEGCEDRGAGSGGHGVEGPARINRDRCAPKGLNTIWLVTLISREATGGRLSCRPRRRAQPA